MLLIVEYAKFRVNSSEFGDIRKYSELYSDINRSEESHSRESGNPEKYWIPGQARNDKQYKTHVLVYKN